MRTATVERKTRETEIAVSLDLDGSGDCDIDTGIGFLDHMLESFGRHSMMDLKVRASGDLHVDFHHTTEDTAIAIGQAVKRALGDFYGTNSHHIVESCFKGTARALRQAVTPDERLDGGVASTKGSLSES